MRSLHLPLGQMQVFFYRFTQPAVKAFLTVPEDLGMGRLSSGLEHHLHHKGQPLKKTTIRIPGPSCMLNF